MIFLKQVNGLAFKQRTRNDEKQWQESVNMIQHILDYLTFLIPEGMYRFKQAKLFFKKETRRVEFCSIDGKKFNCVAVSLAATDNMK